VNPTAGQFDAEQLELLADLVATRVLDRLSAHHGRRFFTIPEAAEHARVSEDSVRRMLASGRLRALRPVAGRIVVDRRELESAVLGSTSKPRHGRGSGRRNNDGPTDSLTAETSSEIDEEKRGGMERCPIEEVSTNDRTARDGEIKSSLSPQG
jgi:excisionase family DNA binding protein